MDGRDKPGHDAVGSKRKRSRLRTDEIEIAVHTLMPHASGALYWPAERTLLVADLHLEKGAVLAAQGAFLPPYDTHATLRRLGAVVESLDPRRVIALGDSFHRVASAHTIESCHLVALRALQRGRDWYWVTGNHDPVLPRRVGGTVAAALSIGGVTLRHEPGGSGATEIAGHLHPAARMSWNGASVRRRCFVADGNRIVMPAFGAFTGGLNVLDTAFRQVFADTPLAAWMLGRDAVYAVAGRHLVPDGA